MPIVRSCTHCGAKNRIPLDHLADTGRCGACKQDIAPLDAPVAANTELFDQVLREATVPVLVDFWASWCGPCRMAAPEVERAAQQMAGKAVVLKVDTEQNAELSARYNVRGIPNFAVFARGRLVQQQAGLVNAAQMVQWLRGAASAAA